MNDNRSITTRQFARFLFMYYSGAYSGEKLGQAFINHNHQCRQNINAAATLHKERSDQKAMEIITRDYVQDEV